MTAPIGAHTDTHTEHSIGEPLEQSESDSVIAVLKSTIDTLQGQLAVKDKQIEELNARLAESNAALVAAQQTAQAAQALHAGTIQKQLTDESHEKFKSDLNPNDKRGWLHKIFGK